MGVRTRLANALNAVAKTFGTTVPPAIEAGEAAAQMTPASPFSPGQPIGPYDGYSRTPRTHDFVTGYNIATRPRTHERVAFDTLKGLVEAYDVAQMCIWHRIDSIRSLDWSLIAKSGHDGDVADAIPVAMKVLSRPDGQQPFATWLASWLYDILAYDAGTLYRLRNRGGRAIGLRVVDGTTIAPLLDYWGNPPAYPAESHVQYANGLPWNWLTQRDLIYLPFRKRANSPYGTAPLESILLNANTDLRFQAYFLQRFTEGNIPEAFASAPERWTPQQIEDFQTYWDSFMLGDQAAKHQIKWMPGGSSLAWSNEKDFSDNFSLFLMRKTAAAYHVVPADLGFTENVNRSSGESQADVQHRVGDLPLIRHIQGILSSFLQDDLGLPLDFAFDLGEEQADRLQQAQADEIYVNIGAISPSTVRELRYGLPEPDGTPVPRFIASTRSGPIPLSALYGVAGRVDPATAAPDPGAPLPHTVFTGVEGTQPTPPLTGVPLAEQLYGRDAIPPAPPPQPVAKDDGGAAPTAGVTSATGITGYDLIGCGEDDEEPDEPSREELMKGELAAFRRFRQARRRAGQWRDFEFRHVGPVQGHRLNDAGRLVVRKAAGEVAVAGLAVLAADTGRVLMLQRALDDGDPAAGMFEFPGGHLEEGESPLAAACREWSEETGLILPFIPETAAALAFDNGPGWTNGIYEGFVYQVPSEDVLDLRERGAVSNPDDPDGDLVEAVAWWDPAQLPGNPAVRPELLASLPDVLAALGCPTGEMVEKATAGKGDAPTAGAHWPGWNLDERCADHWAPLIADTLTGALNASAADRIARDYAASGPRADPGAGKRAAADAAYMWLAGHGIDLVTPLAEPLAGLFTDAYLVGLASADHMAEGDGLQLDSWQPGNTVAAREAIAVLAGEDDLASLLATVPDAARSIADAYLHDMARELADSPTEALAKSRIGDGLRRGLGNIRRATSHAITTITRVSGLAALLGYKQRGVTNGQWLIDPDSSGCPVCDMNAAAGPVPIGEPYPSGDVAPPSHPNCRCAIGVP